MKRIATVVTVVVTAALALFAGGWKASDIHRDHVRGTFQQRQHCASLANHFLIKQRANADSMSFLTVDDVGYSGDRDSCVAEISTTSMRPGMPERQIDIFDVLSESALFTDMCLKPCSGEQSVKLTENAAQAFVTFVRR
jgi:hypothetical protein